MLTSFLVWPLLLAWLLPPWTYWADMPTMFGYVAIIAAEQPDDHRGWRCSAR